VKINYQPIGLIHSPFKDIAGMSIQPSGAASILEPLKGQVQTQRADNRFQAAQDSL
jgi:hypothetical protein